MYIIPMDAGHRVIMRMMYLNLRSSVHRRLTFNSTSFQYVCRPPSPLRTPMFDDCKITNFFSFHQIFNIFIKKSSAGIPAEAILRIKGTGTLIYFFQLAKIRILPNQPINKSGARCGAPLVGQDMDNQANWDSSLARIHSRKKGSSIS